MKKLTVLMIGLGGFGRAICDTLHEHGVNIIGVDKTRSIVEELSDELDYVAQLDATDESALIKIGAKNVDIAIVALGEKTESNILTTAVLRDLGIPKIIARSDSPLHSRILKRVGAHQVISPEREMGRRVAELIVNPWLEHFAEFDNGEIIVGVLSPLDEMLGKSIQELQFSQKFHTLIIMIQRGEKKFIPKADTVLQKEDKLWVFGLREDLEMLIKKTEEARI